MFGDFVLWLRKQFCIHDYQYYCHIDTRDYVGDVYKCKKCGRIK